MRIFRESLTAIAGLFALALLALAIAPPFIDWNTYRGQIAEVISQALGQPVTFSGDLRLSFLPTPEIDADDVKIGPPERPLLRAGRLTLSLSALPLVRGAIQITQARGDRVTARAELADLAIAMSAKGLSPREVGIDRLDIKGLSILKAGSDTPWAVGLDFVLEAPSLVGPFRFDLIEPKHGRELRGQVGKIEDGRARLKAVLEDQRLAGRASFDGMVGVPGKSGRPLFDGAVQFNGNPVVGPVLEGAQIPFDGQARLVVVADQVIADPVTISVGGGEQAVSYTGNALLDLLPPRPSLRLALSARRLDLVRLFDDEPATNRDRERLKATAHSLAHLDRSGDHQNLFNLDAEVSIAHIQLPQLAVRDFRLVAKRDADGMALHHLSAQLPGASALSFERSPAGMGIVDGALSLASSDLPVLMQSFGIANAGDMPKSLQLRSAMSTGTKSVLFETVELESAGALLTGDAALDLPVAGERDNARLRFSLAAERFNARLLALADPLRGGGPGLAVDGRLAIRDLLLDDRALGGLTLAFSRDERGTRLDELRLVGRTGEELRISGQSVAGATQATAKLDAERVVDLARLTQAVFPGAVTDAFLQRASALEPALAVATIRVEQKDGESVWDIQSDGRFGGTTLAVRTQSEMRGDVLQLALEGEAANPDGLRLLSQLGGVNAQARPGGLRGPGHVRFSLKGNPRRLLETNVNASLAGITLAAEGNLNLFRQAPFEGKFNLSTVDIAPLHRAFGGGAPVVADGTPARIEGRYFSEFTKLTLTRFVADIGGKKTEGEISFDVARGGKVAGQLRMGDMGLASLLVPAIGGREIPLTGPLGGQPFAPGLAPLLAGDLWIEAKSIAVSDGLAVQDPKFVLRFAPDLVSIEGFEGRRDDARFSATLTLARRDGQVEAAGRLGFARLPVPGISGRISGEIPFTSQGATPAELIGALSGGGRMTVEGVRLANAAPAALARLFSRPLEELGALDENRLGARLDNELKSADLPLPTLAVPVTILNGLARFTIPGIPSETGQGRVDLGPSMTIDLPRASYEARLSYRLSEAPKGWRGAPPEVALGWSGRAGLPPGEPRRTLVVSPLLNGLMAITLQRDLETIEAFDADARERAYFLRRTRADASRDAARRNAASPAGTPSSATPSSSTPSALTPSSATPRQPARPDVTPVLRDGAAPPQPSPG
ncbi:AsmA [Rhabdaerophilaceae bacterium]